MTDKFHDPDEGNRRYQQILARLLVAGFGHDDAVAACASNGWQGVARALLKPDGWSDGSRAPRKRAPAEQRRTK